MLENEFADADEYYSACDNCNDDSVKDLSQFNADNHDYVSNVMNGLYLIGIDFDSSRKDRWQPVAPLTIIKQPCGNQ